MPFDATFDSLATFDCPDWFRDAKLGIWAHWGAQSVPRYGDWYARNMYREGTDQYRYHVRTYGHPSQFGYKDVVQLWKAERFDPDELMDRFAAAGARYFVAQAVHHDNFFNYESAVNPVELGEVRAGQGHRGSVEDRRGPARAAVRDHRAPRGHARMAGGQQGRRQTRARSPVSRTTGPIRRTGTCTSTTAGTCRKSMSRYRIPGTPRIRRGTGTGSTR